MRALADSLIAVILAPLCAACDAHLIPHDPKPGSLLGRVMARVRRRRRRCHVRRDDAESARNFVADEDLILTGWFLSDYLPLALEPKFVGEVHASE